MKFCSGTIRNKCFDFRPTDRRMDYHYGTTPQGGKTTNKTTLPPPAKDMQSRCPLVYRYIFYKEGEFKSGTAIIETLRLEQI